jgi:hypothetical protein
MTETKTHWKQLTNPNYIGAYSLQPGEERIVEIVKVVKEPVKGMDGKSEDCTSKTLTKIYGTPYIQDWIGKSVVIYAAKIKAFGDDIEALRIKNVLPALPELNPNHAKWNEAVKALRDGKTTIDKIAKRYSLSLDNRELLISEAI